MNEIPGDLPGLFTLLYAGSGVVFGFLVVWLTNQGIAVWEARHPGQPISGTKRRWLSLGTPAALVLVGYTGLVLLGRVPFTGETAYLAGVNALAAAGFKQIAFATVQSAQKPQIINNVTGPVAQVGGEQTTVGSITSTRDVNLGNRYTDDDPLHGGTV